MRHNQKEALQQLINYLDQSKEFLEYSMKSSEINENLMADFMNNVFASYSILFRETCLKKDIEIYKLEGQMGRLGNNEYIYT